VDLEQEVEITGRIERNLREALADFVAEGATPYGTVSETVDAALTRATFQGMPVVKLGRGNTEGFVGPERADLWIAGSNLTATKARLLLMACLLRFGSLPPAVDAQNPTKKVGTYSIRSYELPEASILGKSNHRTTAYVDQMFDKSAID